jgi:hypothetical protein
MVGPARPTTPAQADVGILPQRRLPLRRCDDPPAGCAELRESDLQRTRRGPRVVSVRGGWSPSSAGRRLMISVATRPSPPDTHPPSGLNSEDRSSTGHLTSSASCSSCRQLHLRRRRPTAPKPLQRRRRPTRTRQAAPLLPPPTSKSSRPLASSSTTLPSRHQRLAHPTACRSSRLMPPDSPMASGSWRPSGQTLSTRPAGSGASRRPWPRLSAAATARMSSEAET